MKQKFIDIVPKIMKPWVDGSAGTPWAFSSRNLHTIGNDSLEPDKAVDAKGNIYLVYLTIEDIDEAMQELGFHSGFYSGPGVDFALAWEVELLPSVIL